MSQDPRWSAETERLVARRLCILDGGPADDCAANAVHQEDAQGVLDALADSGLLRTPSEPDGGQLAVAKGLMSLGDLALVAAVTGGGIRSQEITVRLEDDEPAAPRVWAMPEIPNDVMAVVDRNGDIWNREPSGRPGVADRWIWAKFGGNSMSLQHMLERGPIREALTEVVDGSGT